MTFSEDSRRKLTRLASHAYVGVCEARPGERLHSQLGQDQQGHSAPRGACYTLRHIPAGEGIFGLYPPEAEAEQAFREWRRKKGR
jgi:hypothetical protein